MIPQVCSNFCAGYVHNDRDFRHKNFSKNSSKAYLENVSDNKSLLNQRSSEPNPSFSVIMVSTFFMLGFLLITGLFRK